ncbi:GNAT family N-acetyltransferase [Pedobacter nototheniae]|uniref:GNAT family N-acetyltransferase n=1 Tax=Pedobacter nototheniae TaxID=2488994 RepID=UPI00103C8C53|nr:GNAT family N-acetyltransferase [Pedobacter nototheniae]
MRSHLDNLYAGIEFISTERLILIPFTKEIITSIKQEEGFLLKTCNLNYGTGWPDEEAKETFPKIEKNLTLVINPTGFESWIIVKKENQTIIGDAGFKGRPNDCGEIDIGYAIISAERQNGYAIETVNALIIWAFNQTGVAAITASCFIPNIRSKKVLQKTGFRKTKEDDEMIYWIKNKSDC